MNGIEILMLENQIVIMKGLLDSKDLGLGKRTMLENQIKKAYKILTQYQ